MGEEKFALKVPKGTSALAFAPDGAHLFTGSGLPGGEVKDAPAPIRRIELKSGKEAQTWKVTAGEQRQGLQFVRTDITALYPLADKETLIVVETQVYQPWPPPPGRPGFGPFYQRFQTVRAINLAGREKDRTIDVGTGPLTLAPDGKSIAFVGSEMRDPNKPATVVKVIDATTGAAKALTLATGYPFGTAANPGVALRPGGADLAVRTGDGTVLVVDASKLQDVKAAKPEAKKE
jgi:hypothetical protein